jgi:RNA polymerase sigma-70 factor, ECF subfamily
MTQVAFREHLIAIVPKLRIQALAPTRERAAAEDLVQDTICNALSAQHTFAFETNLAAWMYRILRNRFLTDLQKRRVAIGIDALLIDTPFASAPYESRLELTELAAAIDRLPVDLREALVMVVVHELSYKALAEATDCAVGTAKSRVFRARRQLEAWLVRDRRETGLSEATRTTTRTLRIGRDTETALRLRR